MRERGRERMRERGRERMRERGRERMREVEVERDYLVATAVMSLIKKPK